MSDTEWKRYPRPVYTDPAQIDADIRNGTFARKTRAHAEAVEAWYAQPLFAPLKARPDIFNPMLERRRLQNPQALR